ncbi:MAG: Bro-N domain-containing protein [Prevotellaceae bacterium]|jgi:prophage antirepressor-like protein|nr:Bro-N domain-containing protein [Prevotellaceae bacterium]
MKAELQIFKNSQFGEVRVTKDENGEPMVIAVDVARALGYESPKDAVATHCKSGGALKQSLAYIPHSNGVGGTNSFDDLL